MVYFLIVRQLHLFNSNTTGYLIGDTSVAVADAVARLSLLVCTYFIILLSVLHSNEGEKNDRFNLKAYDNIFVQFVEKQQKKITENLLGKLTKPFENNSAPRADTFVVIKTVREIRCHHSHSVLSQLNWFLLSISRFSYYELSSHRRSREKL